jgi:tetratricopeptide (TPR) repeat protein
MATPSRPPAAFDDVIRLVNAGEMDAAVSRCRGVLAGDPHNINFTALLGAVLMKAGRYAESEILLRRAIELAPGFAKPHEDLGFVLLETGRTEEAANALRQATRLDPRSCGAWFSLGRALADLGHGREADAAFETLFRLSPESGALAHGWKAQQQGRPREAEHHYREALRHNPGNLDAMRLLANVMAKTNNATEAEQLLRKVVDQAPGFVTARIDLGAFLREQDRYEEAIGTFRDALAIEPDDPRIHFLLGGTYAPAGLTFDAIESFRHAVKSDPRHAGAWLGLAHALKTVGRTEEAVDAYRESARLRPNNGEIYWSLANLKTYRFTDEEIAVMQEKLATSRLSRLSEVNMRFALAKAWEDRGDYERAWEYYRTGNELRRRDERHDPVQIELLNEAIRDVFNGPFLESLDGLGDPDPSPIFIVGLPRSGSTLLEQILASHSMVEGTAELPYVGRVATSLNLGRADGTTYPAAARELDAARLRALGRDYLKYAQLHRRRGTPRFVDKMPNNFPHIGLMHLILPAARIIDARRDPMDTCLSCFRQLFARGQPFTYDLVDLGEYYLQYRKMMDHWDSVLPGRVLTVQYEELVGNFENQVRRLLDYCGLPFEENCLRFHETDRPVRSASAQQVRRPLNADAIGRWRHYEKHLDALKEMLAPVLARQRPDAP